jgi:hypothetical protein
MRLVSQEGMEAWQKKLNEVLRMGNGFANAGPIPHDVVQAGQAAIDAYKSKRAEDKPSNAQWVYDQALLQQHAYMNGTITSAEQLRKEGKRFAWDRFVTYWDTFVTYWLRYMVASRMRCVLRARVKWNGGSVSNAKLIEKL